MRFLLIALCAALTLSSGCGYDPCASKETRAAFVGLGGPLGIAAVLALSCPQPEPAQEPIAAVPLAGLELQQPEAVAQPDMGAAADLAEAPPPPAPDADMDGIPDSADRCPTTPSGQTADPARPGCPEPRTYKVVLPVAAFSASGPVTVLDGAATSKAYFNWSTMKRESVALSSIVFFQNGGPNVTNAVSFELTGQADFTTPATTISSCAAFKDTLHQDASAPNPATGNPLDVACIARRIALCPVGIVSDQRRLFDEASCADNVQRGGGYWSAANAPIKLTANVASADWNNSDPQPVPGIEVQVLLSGNLKLSDWQVVATITETLH